MWDVFLLYLSIRCKTHGFARGAYLIVLLALGKVALQNSEEQVQSEE